jgi:hypothetical protein
MPRTLDQVAAELQSAPEAPPQESRRPRTLDEVAAGLPPKGHQAVRAQWDERVRAVPPWQGQQPLPSAPEQQASPIPQKPVQTAQPAPQQPYGALVHQTTPEEAAAIQGVMPPPPPAPRTFSLDATPAGMWGAPPPQEPRPAVEPPAPAPIEAGGMLNIEALREQQPGGVWQTVLDEQGNFTGFYRQPGDLTSPVLPDKQTYIMTESGPVPVPAYDVPTFGQAAWQNLTAGMMGHVIPSTAQHYGLKDMPSQPPLTQEDVALAQARRTGEHSVETLARGAIEDSDAYQPDPGFSIAQHGALGVPWFIGTLPEFYLGFKAGGPAGAFAMQQAIHRALDPDSTARDIGIEGVKGAALGALMSGAGRAVQGAGQAVWGQGALTKAAAQGKAVLPRALAAQAAQIASGTGVLTAGGGLLNEGKIPTDPRDYARTAAFLATLGARKIPKQLRAQVEQAAKVRARADAARATLRGEMPGRPGVQRPGGALPEDAAAAAAELRTLQGEKPEAAAQAGKTIETVRGERATPQQRRAWARARGAREHESVRRGKELSERVERELGASMAPWSSTLKQEPGMLEEARQRVFGKRGGPKTIQMHERPEPLTREEAARHGLTSTEGHEKAAWYDVRTKTLHITPEATRLEIYEEMMHGVLEHPGVLSLRELRVLRQRAGWSDRTPEQKRQTTEELIGDGLRWHITHGDGPPRGGVEGALWKLGEHAKNVGDALGMRELTEPDVYGRIFSGQRGRQYDRASGETPGPFEPEAVSEGTRAAARRKDTRLGAGIPRALGTAAERMRDFDAKPAPAPAKTKQPWEMTLDEIESAFPVAGKTVGGLQVRHDVPNQSSIDASIDTPTVLRRVRSVSISAFDPKGEYVPSRSARVRQLAREIEQSKEINPLILGFDEEGLYVIEGGHRFDALRLLGVKEIPALVVMDEGSLYKAVRQAVTDGRLVPPEVLAEYPDLVRSAKPAPAGGLTAQRVLEAAAKVDADGRVVKGTFPLLRPVYDKLAPEGMSFKDFQSELWRMHQRGDIELGRWDLRDEPGKVPVAKAGEISELGGTFDILRLPSGGTTRAAARRSGGQQKPSLPPGIRDPRAVADSLIKQAPELGVPFRRGVRAGVTAGQRDLTEVHRGLAQYARENLDDYKVLSRAMDRVTKTRTPATQAAAIRAIDRFREFAELRDARADLKAAMRDAEKKPLRRDEKQDYDAIRDTVSTRKRTQRTIDRAIAVVDAAERDPHGLIPQPLVQRAQATLRSLRKTPISEMDVGELRDMADAIRHITHVSERKNEVSGKLRYQRGEQMVSAVTDNVVQRLTRGGKKPRIPFQDEPRQRRHKLEHMRDILYQDQLSHETRVVLLGGADGPAYRVLHDALRDSQTEFLQRQMGVRSELQSALQREGLDWSKVKRWSTETSKRPISTQYDLPTVGKVRLTPAQQIDLYLHLQDSSTRAEVLKDVAEGFIVRDWRGAERRLKFRGADLVHFMENIPREYRAVAEAMSGILNGEMRDAMNAHWMKMFGYEIARQPDYWPRVRERRGTLEEVLSHWQGTEMKLLEGLGIFQERGYSNAPIRLGDAFQKFFRHVALVNAAVTKGPAIRDAMTVVSSQPFRKAVIEGHRRGNSVLEKLEQIIVEFNGTEQRPKKGSTEGLIGGIMPNLHRAALGLRPNIVAYQTVSLGNASVEIPARYMTAGLKGIKPGRIRAEMEEWSPDMWHRINSGGHGIVSPSVSGEGIGEWLGKPRSRWDKATMGPIGWADTQVMYRIWEGAKAMGRAQGLSGDDLMRWAAKKAVQTVDRTQPTWDTLTISMLGVEGKSKSFQKLLTMFSSQRNKNFNMAVRALAQYQEDPSPRAFSKMAYGVAMPLIFNSIAIYGMRTGYYAALQGGQDPRGKRKEVSEHVAGVINQGLGNWLIVGEIPATAVENVLAATEGRLPRDPQGNIVAGAAMDSAAGLGRLMASFFNENVDPVKGARQAARGLGMLYGVPIGAVDSQVGAIVRGGQQSSRPATKAPSRLPQRGGRRLPSRLSPR